MKTKRIVTESNANTVRAFFKDLEYIIFGSYTRYQTRSEESKKLDVATGGQDDLRESVIKSISKLNDREEPPKEQKGQGLKIMTPKQIVTRLTILLAQKQAGNNSNKLKNEIRQMIYSLYRSKNLSKTFYNYLINSI